MPSKIKVVGYKSLTENLMDNYNLLSEGVLPLKTAKEISNMAGKLIKLQTGKLEYNKCVKTNAKVEWWDK